MAAGSLSAEPPTSPELLFLFKSIVLVPQDFVTEMESGISEDQGIAQDGEAGDL